MFNTVVVAPAHVGIDIVTFGLALLLRVLAAELARGHVVTQALFRGHANQRVKDGVVGEGARARVADACRRTVRASWILQLAVRAIGTRLDTINAGPASVGTKRGVGDNDSGQNQETRDDGTHWRCWRWE